MATYRRMLKDKYGNNIIPAGFLDAIYPVGSIYMSATLSSVSQVQNALGGTWETWGAGRVPVGVDTSQTEFDTVEETGGEKKHTLQYDELPEIRYFKGDVDNYDHNNILSTSIPSGSTYGLKYPYVGRWVAHNNLQPYITCYMYKRIA